MTDLYDTSLLKECGDDVRINNLVSIERPKLISIANHVAIDAFFACSCGMDLGQYVHISKHVGVIGGKDGMLKMGNFTNISLGGRIVCGSDAFLGEGLIGYGIPGEYQDRIIIEPVIFDNFANIGASVTILPGVTIPEGTVIGAHSLVRKSDKLEPWTIYAGNPLREIRKRPREKMLKYAEAMGYKT